VPIGGAAAVLNVSVDPCVVAVKVLNRAWESYRSYEHAFAESRPAARATSVSIPAAAVRR
jgi:hypothetical protein